jgi:predicted HAD superfamily Cof-like phosphohydrolase
MRGIIDAVINEKLLLQILPIFDAVHESNMAKLGADGKPIINGQNGVLYPGKPLNKVMKPEGWKDPKEKIFKILSEN